jgi:Methyltransferase domain
MQRRPAAPYAPAMGLSVSDRRASCARTIAGSEPQDADRPDGSSATRSDDSPMNSRGLWRAARGGLGMTMRGPLDHFLRSVRDASRTEGLVGGIRVAARMTRHAPHRLRRYVDGYRFDRREGLETRGRTWLSPELRSAAAHDDGVPYVPTPHRALRQLLASLPLDPGDVTFIDLGCGKGRTLAIAAQHGFRRIVGVELDDRLVHIARKNARRIQTPASGSVQVIHGDASAYRLPAEPMVLYLFNPFGEHTMRCVARAVEAAFAELPRPIFIAYLNPQHRRVFDESPVLRLRSTTSRWVVYST